MMLYDLWLWSSLAKTFPAQALAALGILQRQSWYLPILLHPSSHLIHLANDIALYPANSRGMPKDQLGQITELSVVFQTTSEVRLVIKVRQ